MFTYAMKHIRVYKHVKIKYVSKKEVLLLNIELWLIENGQWRKKDFYQGDKVIGEIRSLEE